MRAWTALRHGCHYRGFVALLPAAVASTWGALAISRAGSCSVGGHRGVCAVFNCMSWGTGKRRGWGDTERELRQWGQQPWLEHAQIGAVQPEPSQLSPAPALSSGESSPCARGGACSSKATRRFDAGKRCLSLRILRYSPSLVLAMVTGRYRQYEMSFLPNVCPFLARPTHIVDKGSTCAFRRHTKYDTATGDGRASACRPLERFQNLVRHSGGVSGLIDNILMVAKTTKLHQAPTEEAPKAAVRPVFPKDGGLPEDAVADALGLLPDSSFTRMLRYNGRSPAWFTQRPDHKSD